VLGVAEREQTSVRQARAGEPEAWDALFRRYQRPLYTYVFELVHEEQESLDIVQESFIAATRHIAGLCDDAKFGSWLFGIAHQKCIPRWRKKGRDQQLRDAFEDTPAEFESGPDDLLIRREQEEEFMKRLHQLPFAHRSALLLHYIEGFSLAEIAAVTGAGVGTVKSRLHYARKAFEKLL
jgi:RNA polymerase sigma-70 factor (ECF subfamily)